MVNVYIWAQRRSLLIILWSETHLIHDIDTNKCFAEYLRLFSPQKGMLPWWPLLWLHRTHSRFAPSLWEMPLACNDISHWLGASLESTLTTEWLPTLTCNSYEDQAPIDFIYGCLIFRWVAVTCRGWEGTRLVVPTMAIKAHIPLQYLGISLWFVRCMYHPGINLVMRSANERCCYNVTMSVIDWMHT